MSESIMLISSFTQLIENSRRLSSQEIADHTLKMMQMLASNPSLLPAWKQLQQTLEDLYNSLEEVSVNEPSTGNICSTVKQLMS